MSGTRIWSSQPGGGSSAPDVLTGRSGRTAIAGSAQTVSVVFSTPLALATYSLLTSIENTSDTDPIYLNIVSITKLTTGFTVEFNAPTDSANYYLNWVAANAV